MKKKVSYTIGFYYCKASRVKHNKWQFYWYLSWLSQVSIRTHRNIAGQLKTKKETWHMRMTRSRKIPTMSEKIPTCRKRFQHVGKDYNMSEKIPTCRKRLQHVGKDSNMIMKHFYFTLPNLFKFFQGRHRWVTLVTLCDVEWRKAGDLLELFLRLRYRMGNHSNFWTAAYTFWKGQKQV